MERVKGYLKRDGRKKLDIFKKENGLFQFEETVVDLIIEPDEELGEEGEIYWGRSHLSGLYESMAAADADAKAFIQWLRRGNYQDA